MQSDSNDKWALLDHVRLSAAGACAVEIISPVEPAEATERKLLLREGTRNSYICNALNTETVLGLPAEVVQQRHPSVGTDEADCGALGVPKGTLTFLKFISAQSRRGQTIDVVWHDSRQLMQNVLATGGGCRLDGLLNSPTDPTASLSLMYSLNWDPDKAKAGAIVARLLFAPKAEMEQLLSVAGISDAPYPFGRN